MCKSKSSSASTSDTSQTTLSADGVVTGKVFNVAENSQVNYTEEFSAPVADAFKQLIGLVSGAGEVANEAYSKSLDSLKGFASQASQPDLDLTKTIAGYVPTILISGGALLVAYLIFKK